MRSVASEQVCPFCRSVIGRAGAAPWWGISPAEADDDDVAVDTVCMVVQVHLHQHSFSCWLKLRVVSRHGVAQQACAAPMTSSTPLQERKDDGGERTTLRRAGTPRQQPPPPRNPGTRTRRSSGHHRWCTRRAYGRTSPPRSRSAPTHPTTQCHRSHRSGWPRGRPAGHPRTQVVIPELNRSHTKRPRPQRFLEQWLQVV